MSPGPSTAPPTAPQGGTRRVSPDGDAGDAGGCLFGVLLLGTVITGGLTLFYALLWLGALPASLAATGWTPVPGVLTQATYFGDCNSKVRGGGPTYPLSLTYSYTYADTAYIGHLLGPTRWHHFHRADCGRGVPEALRAGFPPHQLGDPGTPVTVFVNTTLPAQAALDKGLPSFGRAGRYLLVFLPLLLLSVWLLRQNQMAHRDQQARGSA